MADQSLPQKKPYPLRALKPLPVSKYCSRCKEFLPASRFYRCEYLTMTGRTSVKLSAECRECHQKPLRRGRRPSRAIPVDSTCKKCGETKPIERYDITRKVAKRGTVSYCIAGTCKDCRAKCRRKKARKEKDLKPIPWSKTCNRCGETKSFEKFRLRIYKTSTGRSSRKLHSMCDPCRQLHERSKLVRKGTPKGVPPHPVDKPKRCSRCSEIKDPNLFGRIKRGTRLASRCKQCYTASRVPSDPDKARQYYLKRKASKDSDPSISKREKAYLADHFQRNKERIRLRNIEERRRNPEKHRLRAVANIARRRAFGDDRKMPEVREAIASALESYRIGDQYWDVYESKLIDVPTVDHLSAISRGGTNAPDNLTVTSRENNSSKGTLPLIVWLAKRADRTRKQQLSSDC